MAAKSTASTDGPLTLHFQDMTRVAGETMQGRVDLNVQLAQEDNLEHVRIRFRGIIHAMITTERGNTNEQHRETIVLFHTKFPLWQQGTSPAPGSRLVSIPFEFTLPSDLPPSFHCEDNNRYAVVIYSLEVVGERAGFFRYNRRIWRAISVVPAATQSDLLVKESLRQSWNGGWKTYAQEEKLRKGIWGDYSHVRVKLTMPDLPSFPIATPIPFSFYVETDTKPMHQSDVPVSTTLFPAPPAASDVTIFLRRWVELRARRLTRQVTDERKLLGSLGDRKCVASVRRETSAPEWVADADKKGHGIWRRSVKFDSTVSIPCAPTFSTKIVECGYQLKFLVPYVGFGNDVKIVVPIRLNGGVGCPPPPAGAAGSSSITYADVLPAGPPPPMLDLPPAYWSEDHHGWDADEKS